MDAVVEELPPSLTAEDAFARLCRRVRCVFLDSAAPSKTLGRYSFLACDPFEWIERSVDDRDALAEVDVALRRWETPSLAELPPFQGGAAGLLAYDLNRSLERLPSPRFQEFPLPALAMGLYDIVVAFDHQQTRAWVISQGWPAPPGEPRRRRASQRLRQMLQWLEAPPECDTLLLPASEVAWTSAAPANFAPLRPTPYGEAIRSCFSRDEYLTAARRCIELIYAGDAFQVNLAHRLLAPAWSDAASLYRRLRLINPAPFAGYFDLGETQVCSASPERFVAVRDRWVESRPIKGTRRRRWQPEADLFAAAELQASPKDVAENVMIVDLMRNDLSRVCQPDSVQVAQLCGLETYQFVLHLVSAIVGRLRDDVSLTDLVRAVFPGGSITGAPKIRAMEIIAELEPAERGAYCGSLGYLGFNGEADLSILIRTLTAAAGWWRFPVGGGIVAQSDPEREYDETWDKARGLVRAVTAT